MTYYMSEQIFRRTVILDTFSNILMRIVFMIVIGMSVASDMFTVSALE